MPHLISLLITNYLGWSREQSSSSWSNNNNNNKDTHAMGIGPNDVVSVQGQYLYNRDGSRFFMKGIAFPVSVFESYNATAWIGILRQLAALDLEYNTVRVYRMDPSIDYAEFFETAASLGIYVIVPLTGSSGGAILDRGKAAPHCYTADLFEYGRASLENYLRHPNVLAGMLANEVMNNEDSWKAAPCIRAYARDLKLYMRLHAYRRLPLIYAAQHSGIGGAGGDVSTMWLTLNYLTCKSSSISGNTPMATLPSSVDVMGINVESFCSSQESFVFNEDGDAGSYYSLWLGLHQSTVPLVFTEMGCSHSQFDRDNGLGTPGGIRDWRQVSIVLHEMSDTWSGFCAYAYHGNTMFNMFEGGPWRTDPLTPTEDFFNFRDALRHVTNDTRRTRDPPTDFERVISPSCEEVQDQLLSCCGIELYDYSRIPTYAIDLEGSATPDISERQFMWILVAAVAFTVVGVMSVRNRTSLFRRPAYQSIT